MGPGRCTVCDAPGEHHVALTIDGEFAAAFPLCGQHVRALEQHEWLFRLYGDDPSLQINAQDLPRVQE